MSPKPQNPLGRHHLSRRDFLRLVSISAAGMVVSSCQPKLTAVPTPLPGPSMTPAPKTPVAIGRVQTYDRAAVEKQVQTLIEQLGGLGDVVKPGDSVAIKPNLTGGVKTGLLAGSSAIESFITHPEVVRALIKQVQTAGAKEVFIVESVYEWASYTDWGYEEVAKDTGAKLLDLNDPKPYSDFVETPVGPDSYIYKSFTLHPILKDINVFMSVSKMKNHDTAGVTHTMKNLYGLAPLAHYRLNENDTYRSAFHGAESETRTRLPRIIIDINRVRPINFSLIDGIMTTQGGEGPWIPSMSAIQPGLLIAGKNPVATDSVATAVMGHNPQAAYPDSPFFRADNHIQLAYEAGLGTNRLDEIEVRGESISEVQHHFIPSPPR